MTGQGHERGSEGGGNGHCPSPYEGAEGGTVEKPVPPARAPEATARAVGIGLLLAVIMGAANVYLGLKAGMTVSASIPAAVVAMGILRLLPRRGSVLESNIVQTAASAGESLAAGIIFTMPALVIAGLWDGFAGWEPFLVITAIAFAGGLLGVLFMIPMRRVFVVEASDLPYPEGVACAEVLRSGERAGRGLIWISAGMALGGVVKLLVSYFRAAAGKLAAGFTAGNRVFYAGLDVSPALVAVGFIVGLRIAVQIFLGGAIGWLVAIPLLGGYDGREVEETAYELWSAKVRYLGVGAMVVGGVATVYRVRSGLAAAIGELRAKFRRGGDGEGGSLPDTERDIGPWAILTASFASVAAILALYYHLTGHVGITLITGAAMVVLAFFFTAVASYIVGLVGNSNSPVSGMTITAVLATAVLVALFGYAGSEAILATLGVAGVVCCAACTSGDVCNDLKTGRLVGASPRRQQLVQIAAVAVASFVMWPVLHLLHEGEKASGGIGGRELSAPQATLFAKLTQGFFGDGEIPRDMFFYGVLTGVAVLAADRLLAARARGRANAFRLHLMPIAVGIYLPIELSAPILVGGVLAAAARRVGGVRGRDGARGAGGLGEAARTGVLVASGLIAGEALTGVLTSGLKLLEPALGYSSATWTPGSAGSFLSVFLLAATAALLLLPARQKQ